jgi:hypothetical protein
VTARSRLARAVAFAGLSALTGTMLPSSPAAQDTSAQDAQARPERRELPPLTAQIPPAEALAAIKRRAQKVLEARRAARRLKFSGEASEAVGYETNPANSVVHKGDTYFDQSTYLTVSKQLTTTLNWSSSYAGNYLKYLDYGDGDYTDHTLTASKVRWQPGRTWRVESWLDLEYNYYPKGKDSTYRNFKTVTRLRQNLLGAAYHQLQYEYFVRDYATKNARDGDGSETFSNRADRRNRLRYKVGGTVEKALLSIENDFYRNDSNDARQDFYDSDVWKITGSLSGNATKQLYLSGTFAFERKNYRERKVNQITAEARYDDKYTMTSGASYDVNQTWKIAYDVSFDHLDSNETTGEFDNAKHAVKVTARF